MSLGCYECGLPYKSPRFADFVVPDHVWKRISPTQDEGGILCAACILGRLTLLGIECEGRFTSGPCAQHDWQKPRSSRNLNACVYCDLQYISGQQLEL